MPISENEFGKSSRDPSLILVDFLSTNYRNAYTLDELTEMMAAKGRKMSKQDVERLLTALEYGGKVKSRVIDGVTYYKYSKLIGIKLT